MNSDVVLLFVARGVRLFAYGMSGVILALYLNAVGLTDQRIGLLLYITLVGDAGISLLVTLYADAFGRRRMLLLGCLLKLTGAVILSYVHGPMFWLLVAGCTIGVISPSGNEVGPFLALEQSVLADQVQPTNRTMVFAWYSFLGSCTSAIGSLMAGFLTTWLVDQRDFTQLDAYRMVFVQYGGISLLLMVLVGLLSSGIEVPVSGGKARLGGGGRVGSVYGGDGDGDGDAELSRPLLFDAKPDSADLAHERNERMVALKRVVKLEGEAGGRGPGGEQAPALERASSGAGGARQPLLSAPAPKAPAPDGGDFSAVCVAGEPGQAAPPPPKLLLGLSPRSQGTVLHLCCLFVMDSFASGMITGALLAYYFQVTWKLHTSTLGAILFGANMIGGLSSLASGWVAGKLGLINTMVFTHLPSNVFLILVPFMPTAQLAIAMVFLRFSISQMDVVPRQSYVSGVVSAEERTATMGITNIVRSLGAACGPLVTGWLASGEHFGWAFVISGLVQILYDLALLWSFRQHRAAHEQEA